MNGWNTVETSNGTKIKLFMDADKIIENSDNPNPRLVLGQSGGGMSFYTKTKLAEEITRDKRNF